MAGYTREELNEKAEAYGFDKTIRYQELSSMVSKYEREHGIGHKPAPPKTRRDIDLTGVEVVIQPEQRFILHQLQKYEQEFPDYEIVENPDPTTLLGQDGADDRTVIKGARAVKQKPRPVVFSASMPKYNNKQSYIVGVTPFRVIEHSGKKGYLWRDILNTCREQAPELIPELTDLRGEFMINNQYAIEFYTFNAWYARHQAKKEQDLLTAKKLLDDRK